MIWGDGWAEGFSPSGVRGARSGAEPQEAESQEQGTGTGGRGENPPARLLRFFLLAGDLSLTAGLFLTGDLFLARGLVRVGDLVLVRGPVRVRGLG